jgi:hypothetical protein
LRRPENRRPLLAALLALFAIAGCGGDRNVDSAKAEAFARSAITPAPRRIDCPVGVKVEKGKSFDCHVIGTDGTRSMITLHISDDEGNVTVGAGDLRPSR